MKLLFDENLSHRLAASLADLFPDSVHVRDVGLECSEDKAVWEFVAANGFAIISKDEDFHQRSFAFGHPPKVIWVRLGNVSTKRIETAIRNSAEKIRAFDRDPAASYLMIG
ncbi:MAG: DUF5615 family PIN-like protein [Planctomycetota bacterium]